MPGTDALSLVFSALADPTRRAILVRLSEGEATVNELAAPFDISLPAISRHLKVLAEAGLIERSRQAQWRGSSLKADGLTGATGFIEDLTRVWGERFDRLDAHLDFLKAQLGASTQTDDSSPPPASPDDTSSTPASTDGSPPSTPSIDDPVPSISSVDSIVQTDSTTPGDTPSHPTQGDPSPSEDGAAPSGGESV